MTDRSIFSETELQAVVCSRRAGTRRMAAAAVSVLVPVLVPVLISGVVLAVAAPCGSAAAADGGAKDKDTVMFLGQPVSPRPGTFVVTKDLNVRDKPDTSGKKVSSFSEGTKITVVGNARGSWVAVREDGKDLGFVYGPVLMPLLDAVVKEPLTGRVEIAGGACDFRIVFEGESPIEGQLFNSVDYRTALECRRAGASFAFEMPMFITEGPYNGGSQPVHQIGMDVLELAQEYERVFSTNLLYDAEKGEIRLDSVSVDKYLTGAKKRPSTKAGDVASALVGGVGLAARSWSRDFWSDLARALRGASN
jgi:hypothetical protein